MENKKNLVLIITVIVISLVLLVALVYWVILNKKEVPSSLSYIQEINPAKLIKATATVEITESGFSPATITVEKGTLITFVNKDDNDEHRIAGDLSTLVNFAGFGSTTNLKEGDTYSYLFNKAGTYSYHDYLNPLQLKGTIVVE